MTKLDDLPPLRELIAQHGLAARKGLGQHFLLDLNLTRKIVAQAGDLTGVTVFEVGPGPGGLTRAILASNAHKLIVVEMDDRCLPILAQLQSASEDRMQIIHGDALQQNFTQLSAAPRAIIANLPYNVATPLLIGWLAEATAFQSFTLMFQSEVVDRIVAEPDTRAYGRLAVICQYICEAKRVMSIPARAFTPAPKVDSAVVHLKPRQGCFVDFSMADLEQITAAAFGQRRKMLRSSLKALGGEALLAAASIDGNRRAETLSVAEFSHLTRIWRQGFRQ